MTSERAALERLLSLNMSASDWLAHGDTDAADHDLVASFEVIRTALAVSPAPREDGWEERLLVLLENEGVVTWGDEGHRARFLAILDRLATRGEPPEPGPAIDVERLARAMATVDYGNVATLTDNRIERAHFIAAEYDRLRP